MAAPYLSLSKGTASTKVNTEADESKQEERRDKLKSGETMFRFYSKELNKTKRLTTPGYIGENAYLCFYRKYNRFEKELEHGENGYSPSTAYLATCNRLRQAPAPYGFLNRKADLN